MSREKEKALTILHEGVRRFPYYDTASPPRLTIGVGFNLTDVGLLPEEIDFILDNRLRLCRERLTAALPWFQRLDEVRQAVLIDMEYNMGPEPFDGDGIKDWPIFLKQVEDGQYTAAANNMRSTKWAKQVGRRALRLAHMMESGEWPDGIA